MMETSWHSYPSIFALGHRALENLLDGPTVIEEKIDGSQFSFGSFVDEQGYPYLRCRSKGCELNLVAPEGMFVKAVEVVQEFFKQERLVPGWTYRAEYLAKPKHNTLAYSRTPNKHLIIFDVNTGHEAYLSYTQKRNAAFNLGLEVVPEFAVPAHSSEAYRALLDRQSCLGGQKIEGFVVKNYAQFGPDKKVLMGKFVSEAFKESHSKAWKVANPGANDIISQLIDRYTMPARWHKAVQHLREAGKLEESPRDIGQLIKEVPADIEKECAEAIKDALFTWAWPKIRRGVTRGLPEWYKEELLKQQFKGKF